VAGRAKGGISYDKANNAYIAPVSLGHTPDGSRIRRNPWVLAEMARRRMRSKIPRLQEALDCSFFTPSTPWCRR
jgi:hypothetical protein